MLTLDQEVADLIAANAVRNAMGLCPEAYRHTMEAMIIGLHAKGKIDDRVAHYVLTNRDRFVLREGSAAFDARWRVEAEGLSHARV